MAAPAGWTPVVEAPVSATGWTPVAEGEQGGDEAQPVTAGPASVARPTTPDTSIPYLTDIGHALYEEAHGLANAPVSLVQAASRFSPAPLAPGSPIDLKRGIPATPTSQTIDNFVNRRQQDFDETRKNWGESGFSGFEMAGEAMNPANYLVPESKSVNILARVGRSAIQGGVAGVQQPVVGEDQKHFWTTKAEQGGIGAAVGTLLHPVVGLIKKAAAPVVEPILNYIKGIKGEDVIRNKAIQEIGARIAKDGTKTQDILDALNAAPSKPLTLTDLGGENVRALAGKISRAPGEGREIITSHLNNRDLDAGLRLSSDVNAGVGSGSPHTAAKALAESRAAESAPLYNEAFGHKGNQNIASPEIDAILATPAGSKALKQAGVKMQNDMTLAGKPDPELLAQAKEAGQYIPFKGGIASGLKLRTLDYVKRSLDDQIGAALRSGEKDEARILQGLKGKLVSALDAADSTAKPAVPARPGKIGQRAPTPAKPAVPGAYQRARATYSGASQSMEALEAGEKYHLSSPEEIADQIRGLSPGDKEFYKMGAAAQLRKSIAKAGPGGDESAKVINSSYTREQLRPLFDSDEDFNKFVSAVKAEKTMFDTRRAVLGGSDTARRLTEDATPDSGAGNAGAALLHAYHGNAVSATKQAFEGIAKYARMGYPTHYAEMARMLTTPLQGSGANFLRNIQAGGGPTGLARNLLTPGAQGALAGQAPHIAAGIGASPAPQRAAAALLPEQAMGQLRSEMGDTLVNKLAGSGKLNIVKSAADLPDTLTNDMKKKAIADPTIKGFYNGDGRSFIIADRHTPDSIRGAFLHEVGEHHSLGEMMGDKYHTYLDNLSKSTHEEVTNAASHVDKYYPELNRKDPMFWREVSAHLAETSPENSPWWKEMYQNIRNWATKQGIKLNLSPQDVRSLVKQGLKNQEKADFKTSPSAQKGAPITADESPQPTFYSALERNLKGKEGMPSSADPKRWTEWLDGAQRRGEIKKEERDWTGIDDWLNKHPGQVTRKEIQDFAEQSRVQLKEATPQGGEDEHRLNAIEDAVHEELINGNKETWGWVFGHIREDMPKSVEGRQSLMRRYLENESDGAAGSQALDRISDEVYNRVDSYGGEAGGRYAEYQLPGGTNYREHVLTLPVKENPGWATADDFRSAGKDVYSSPHWDESNIVAHVRTNDRVMDGKKDLHVEEVQSDWHQAGREEGYKGENRGVEAKHIAAITYGIYDKSGAQLGSAAGDSPESALKAYNGSKHTLDRQVPDAPFKKTWDLLAMKQMIRRASEEGYDRISWTPGEEQNARYPERGEAEEAGMKKFYDEIMPKKVADYIKKWGGAIKTSELKIPAKLRVHADGKGKWGVVASAIDPLGQGEYEKMASPKSFDTKEEAEEFMKTAPTDISVKVQYFDITPEMRKAALLGQPMFQKGGQAASKASVGSSPEATKNFLNELTSKAPSKNNLKPGRTGRVIRAAVANPLVPALVAPRSSPDQ